MPAGLSVITKPAGDEGAGAGEQAEFIMPTEGKAWRHIVISTVNNWLPGDPRGFRAEGHKIHSSGDYKNPPPEGEHEGLHRYSKKISGDAILIPDELLATVGKRIVEKLKELEHRVLAVSVSTINSHWLVELPDSILAIRKIVGQCMTASSHAHTRNNSWTCMGQARQLQAS